MFAEKLRPANRNRVGVTGSGNGHDRTADRFCYWIGKRRNQRINIVGKTNRWNILIATNQTRQLIVAPTASNVMPILRPQLKDDACVVIPATRERRLNLN